MYRVLIKPFFDCVAALFALLVFSPIMLILFVVLSISYKGSPFFFQKRPGMGGRIFKIIKFKTMSDDVDELGNLKPDKDRLTNTGKFIRKTSLDELPQLFNVIKFDMSFVGPRPLRVEYLELYSPEQGTRHNVRPGITGWAQVNGRNNISWSRKFELDIYYIKHLSFLLDLKILYKTVLKVISARDINTDGEATTVRFNGRN